MQEWEQESISHGWPSFRPAEVISMDTLIEQPNGEVLTRCPNKKQTHLGHNIPDSRGARYCINAVCIAGRSAGDLGVGAAGSLGGVGEEQLLL